MLASSLAHAAVFALTPASNTQPAADVRSGRTAVRLRPSLATPTEVTPQPDSTTPSLTQSVPPEQPTIAPARPTRSTRPPTPHTTPPAPPRLPRVTPVPRRPQLSRPATPPPQAAITSRPQSTPPPRPTQLAPPPPATSRPPAERDIGANRTLPTALPNNPTPAYPTAAARRGRQGTTIVRMVIGRDGRVTRVSVHRGSGHADLDKAALAAARQWTFQPARRGDQAISITVLKPFRFVLQRR